MMPLVKSSRCSVIDRKPTMTAPGRADRVREPVDDPEHQEDGERQHAGDDLVLGQARDEEPDREEAAAEQQQAEVAGEDRLQLGVPEPEEDRDVDRRHQEHRRKEAHRPEELAEDDLQVRDRRGEQQLDRARPLLFGVGPHRDERHHEEDDDRDVVEDAANQVLVDVDVPAAAHRHALALLGEAGQVDVEEGAEEQREEADQDVAHRRREIPAQFLAGNREDVANASHEAPPRSNSRWPERRRPARSRRS